MGQPTFVFIEFGEYAGSRYDEEGFADVHRCVDCGFQFADLAPYNLDTRPVDEDEAARVSNRIA